MVRTSRWRRGPSGALVDGSGLTFEDRDRHELKGITGARDVFALTDG
jgi:hypothetical protein